MSLKPNGFIEQLSLVAQVGEIVEQLRGESDRRQVPGAKIGLSHCQGFGGAVTVHICSKTRAKGASAA